MALQPSSPDAFDFVAHVARAYASLVESRHADPESGLGGKLLYAGELNGNGRVLVVAANIAGAATLAVTAVTAAQKQALRDGIVDCAVTTLDEALRILKNQLRKRETVSVCVAADPVAVEREMKERGVLPDLLRNDVHLARPHDVLQLHEGESDETDPRKIPALVTWRAGSALARDLAVLDETALACLDPEEWQSRRWLRLAPRYLGRLAQGQRVLETHREFAARFWERINQATERGQIAFAFEIVSYFQGVHDQFHFDPHKH